jgi:Bacterial Ig-like domain/Regulator of chromosome condensation (RCC1) repeat
MVHSAFKRFPLVLALALLGSCGGGGGSDAPTEPAAVITGVIAGFDFNWDATSGSAGGGDSGVGAGADGAGGVGGGGDFGQFRNALVIVRLKDGSLLGSAKTDPNNGMVTIYPGKTYQGPLYLELRGSADATYYEEGKDAYVPFPEGAVVRAIVPKIDKNIGITIITDAAYRLLTEGASPVSGIAAATPAQISAANNAVRDIVNQQFPKALEVTDITRLPFIKSATLGKALPVNSTSAEGKRGVYGLVSGAFSKQAAMFNANDATPTLSALKQLGEDLRDGKLDGMNGAQAAVAADKRTYDPQSVAGELSAALAQQSFRFGDTSAEQALPPVTNFGNVRYEGYLFDASLNNKGEAFTTVSGWVSVNDPGDSLGGLPLGTPRPKATPAPRVFGVFGNFGHGGMFLKTDAANSQSAIYAVGDNTNGELGVGNKDATQGSVVPLQLPGVLTHVAGGLSHTVARLADGSVYTWGDNLYGQLGQGVDWNTLQGSTTPLKVNLPAGAVAVAASNTASYALFADGTVYSWGSSWGFGLLGDGAKDGVRTTPGAVMSGAGPLADVVQISARDNDVVVLKRDGSLWTWGAHPSDNSAYVPGDPTAPYAGGSPLPTQILGLPAGTQVRKIITEQGLFAVLASDGRVYTWGVHYDLTAASILRVLTPQMVLNLPPIRDLMPGGYVGYGVRPFDRLTSMAIDYHGGMWKVRGLVAEKFDPVQPTIQRRPQHAASTEPFPACSTCHIALPDWPLAAPAATSGATCVAPAAFHESGGASLVHQDTACEMCHNPLRASLKPSFTNGWLNCTPPTNLPVRPAPVGPPTPPVGSPECQVPVGHVFTPPGTVCASCHNSIIAVPLQSLVPACVTPNPNSTLLPTLRTTATITGASSGGTPIAPGAIVSTTSPSLQGTVSAALLTGQTLRVLRNGTAVGAATVSGTIWSYADSGVPNGAVVYTVRVEALPAFGATSNRFAFTTDTVASAVAANVVGVDEDAGAIANNAFTTDTTPTVKGALQGGTLVTGDVVSVLRNGVRVGNATVSGTGWIYAETAALALGDYTYTARVVDAAGNLGGIGSNWTVRVTSLPATPIARLLDNPGGNVLGAATSDNTPRIEGTIVPALQAGQIVRVLRNGVGVGTATVTGTTWVFDDSLPLGTSATQTYTARAEAGTLFGVISAGASVLIDTVAPAAANVTTIFDDFVGTVPVGGSTTDSTPLISGTLTAALNAVAGASTETLQVLRNGVVMSATPAVSGLTWSVTEPVAMAAGATNSYSARVVDAAGNQSAAGAARTVAYDATTRTASIGGATNLNNGAAIASGASSFTNATSLRLNGSISTALLAGQTVRVLRNGTAISPGIATVSSLSWTFDDTSPPNGALSYTVRVESSGATGSQSLAYSFTVDTVRPAQTFTISASSDTIPFSALSGATPPGNNIPAGGTTNDPRPTIRVQLSSALSSGEQLVIRRVLNGGSATDVSTLSTENCGTNCFLFSEAADVVSIPLPPAAPNSALPSGGAVQYRAVVRDAATNETLTPGTLSFTFNYFDCNQARANDTAATAPTPPARTDHSLIPMGAAASPGTNCSGCHLPFISYPSSPFGTPAGTFVPVPKTTQTYWCRRPS